MFNYSRLSWGFVPFDIAKVRRISAHSKHFPLFRSQLLRHQNNFATNLRQAPKICRKKMLKENILLGIHTICTNFAVMKRIAVFCVTFNSDKELENYKASLLKAVEKAEGKVSLDIFVSQNTKEDNPGYFGGIRRAMLQTDVTAYDYAIISNVDLTVEEDFLAKLAAYDCTEDTGWIAPQIWSAQEGRDRNPKIMSRYSLKKLRILKAIFHFPPVWALKRAITSRQKKGETYPAGEIYGGHGSFIILTKHYFERCGVIDYPVFLFCEEIWLAEQCKKAGLKVIYEPTLIVSDAEHASTGRMKLGYYCSLNEKALQYIIDTFY